MTTLTIELPEPLSQQLQGNNISPQQLEKLIIRLIQLYLHQQELRETINLFEQVFEQVPYTDTIEPRSTKPHRQAGRAKHLNIKMSADFDKPLEDFVEYME